MEKNGYEPSIAPERIPRPAAPRSSRTRRIRRSSSTSPGPTSRAATARWTRASPRTRRSSSTRRTRMPTPILGLLALRGEEPARGEGRAREGARGRDALPVQGPHGAGEDRPGRRTRRSGRSITSRRRRPSRPAPARVPGRAEEPLLPAPGPLQEAGKEDMAIRQMEELTRSRSGGRGVPATRIVAHYMKAEGEEAARKALRCAEEVLLHQPLREGDARVPRPHRREARGARPRRSASTATSSSSPTRTRRWPTSRSQRPTRQRGRARRRRLREEAPRDRRGERGGEGDPRRSSGSDLPRFTTETLRARRIPRESVPPSVCSVTPWCSSFP